MDNDKKENILAGIVKSCFPDYTVSVEDIHSIISGKDMQKKQWLFNRILYYSDDALRVLSVFFQKDELKQYFDNFKLAGHFRPDETVFLALRNVILHEHNYIEKLQWKKL